MGVAIGVAGLKPVTDLRGQPDLTGRPYVTEAGTADEIAGAASLLMGQAAEVRPWCSCAAQSMCRDGRLSEILRPPAEDLFR